MATKKIRYYAIKENDETVKTGKMNDCLIFLNTTPYLFLKAFNNDELINGKYYIEETQNPCKDDNSNNEKEMSTYEYLVFHLGLYGNTVLPKNPKRYLQRLKNDGYIVEVDYYPSQCERTRTGHIETTSECYVLTLKGRIKNESDK